MSQPWTAAEAGSEAVSKKMLLVHMQEHASADFLAKHKLTGQVNAVLKRLTKDTLVAAYTELIGGAAPAAPAGGAFKFDAAPAAPEGGGTTSAFKFTAPTAAAAPAPAFSFSPPTSGGPAPAFQFNFGASPAPAPAARGGAPPVVQGIPVGGNADGDDDDDDADEDEDEEEGAMRKAMARMEMSAQQRRDAMVSTLPQGVRSKIEKLEKLQATTDELQKELKEKLQALTDEYEAKKAPLFKQRAEVVSKGVPGFWLQALQNHMMIAEDIHKKDEDVLKHLVDIKCSTKLSKGKGWQLAFHFTENAYFEDTVLTKTYLLDPDDDDECVERSIGTKIKWKEGKNVTVHLVEKKQKKKGKVRTVKVEEPAESFFKFFDPPEVPEDEEEMDEEEAEALNDELEHDFEVGCAIKDKIVQRAVHWFTGMAVDDEEDYDEDGEEEDDDEEEDEEEDDDDDEDEDDDDDDDDDDKVDTSKPKMPQPGPGQPAGTADNPECKQQ